MDFVMDFVFIALHVIAVTSSIGLVYMCCMLWRYW
jgi:uncharacterized membrane protein